VTLLSRTRFWWLVVIPWVALYHAAASFGIPRHAFHPGLSFEPLPVLPWTSLIYFSEYPAVAAVPFLSIPPDRFRKLIHHCWIAIAIAFLFYFTVPSIAPRPPVPQDAFLGPFLSWERGNYPASVAFPSFHVIWAVLIAHAAGSQSRIARIGWWTWAIGVSLTCVTTGMHWISDIAAGALVCWIALRHEEIGAWSKAHVPAPGYVAAAIAVAMVHRRLWVLDSGVAAHALAFAIELAVVALIRIMVQRMRAARSVAVLLH
jgi:hypothetical protein